MRVVIPQLNPDVPTESRCAAYYFDLCGSTFDALEAAVATPIAIWPYTPADVAREREELGSPGPQVPVAMLDDQVWASWQKPEYRELRLLECIDRGVIEHYYAKPLLVPVTQNVNQIPELLETIRQHAIWTADRMAAMIKAAMAIGVCVVWITCDSGWIAFFDAQHDERFRGSVAGDARFMPVHVGDGFIEW